VAAETPSRVHIKITDPKVCLSTFICVCFVNFISVWSILFR
jgi:hypothetical protein